MAFPRAVITRVRGVSSGSLPQSAFCSISLATEGRTDRHKIALKSPKASVMPLVSVSNSCNQTCPHPAKGVNLSTNACTSPNEKGTYFVIPADEVNNGLLWLRVVMVCVLPESLNCFSVIC
ncbi:hypothetical protein GOODEAATRI_022378 [Goodea atripinnis]|uniref:Uncharacterized protein n=1 Tax=Goodea atripinnis TaxID=208336 RepID=A0ABV0MWA9_9TELE